MGFVPKHQLGRKSTSRSSVSPSPFDRLRSLGLNNDEFDSGMRSNSKGTRFSRLLSSIALGLSMMMHAVADENVAPGSSGKLEEITVEARKRAESLQDVPVSVATISRVELQNNDATDLAKLGEIVPQVTIGQFMGGTGAVMTIRGISSSPINAGLDQSVSFVTDGVQL